MLENYIKAVNIEALLTAQIAAPSSCPPR